jgi:hypothetical protein
MAARPRTFLDGAGLVWRRQAVLWWIFIVNALLSFFTAIQMMEPAAGALNHSFAADRLVHGFDVAALFGLVAQPESPIQGPGPAFLFFSIVFMVFMLFATGGVLVAYYRDERLTAGPFFEASGYHFWRFLRLLIYFAIALIPLGILGAISGKLYDHFDETSISPFPSVWVFIASAVVILFLLMCLRLWFDMAQVIAVAEDERRMHKALRRAAGLVSRNFGSLFWLYFRISLVSWLVFGFALQLWKNHLQPDSILTAFFLGQAMMAFWLACRLWQRASEALWYRRYQAGAFATAPATEPEPAMSHAMASPGA